MARSRATPRTSFLLALLALTLTALPLQAAETWPVRRAPSREPDPYVFDRKHVAALPKDFLDDATACILYAATTHVLEEDGNIESTTHEVFRLNGRKAVEKLGEFRGIVFTPAYQQVTLHLARIHKPDGKTVEVQPRNLRLRDVATDYQSYDPDKQVFITFPSVGVGDVIEVKWTVRGKNPEHLGQFFVRYSFGDLQYPIVRDELRVRIPKDRTFHHTSITARLTPAIREVGTARLYTWQTLNRPAPPKDENGPSREEMRPVVVCSTFANWAAVGEWKRRLRTDCWTCTEDIRAVVRLVTAGLTNPRDKARALTYWVRRNVRYVAEGERHDYTPHPPSRVLANRYGDCKDTSQLLAVMFAEAGIPVELATLGAQDDGQVVEGIPSPWGTHAILLANIAGRPHWIDTTTRLTGWDFLPSDDRDRVCYVTDRAGKLRLVRTPKLNADNYRFDQTTEMWIGADGNSRSRRTVVAHGLAAVGQRDTYLEVPPGERRRVVTAELQDSNSRTRLVRLEVDEKALADFDAPSRVTMEYDIPRHFTGETDREGSITDSRVWGRFLSYNLDYARKIPLVFYSPFETSHRYVIHLHPAYRLDYLPTERTIRSPWGEFRVESKALNEGEEIRSLEVRFKMRLEKSRIEPADFDEFRKFQEEVNRRYRVWLTMKPASSTQAIPDLEALLAFAPEDSAAAAALARIYYGAGRSTDAQRVLERARAYQPDDRTLWDLTVKFAPSSAAEEKTQRELVRRFPDDRNRLTLGTILIGRGKHAEARTVLEPLTERGSNPIRAMAHYQLARSFYRKDEPKAALPQLEKAEKLDPDTVVNLHGLLLKARILGDLGRHAESGAAFQRVLALNRDSQEALLALVRVSLLENKRGDALDYLRRYTLSARNDVPGLLLAAEAYLKMGRTDDAYELAQKARDIRFHEKAHRILGLIHLQRGLYSSAARHLDRAEPDATVRAALLRAYLHLGALRDLENVLDRAERMDSPTETLKRVIAQGREVLARRDELRRTAPAPAEKEEWNAALDALACAEFFVRRGPVSAAYPLLAKTTPPGLVIGPALALRGRLALERGKLREALKDAEEAIKLCPKEAGGYYVRGRVRLERESPAALPDLQKANELSGGKEATILHALAGALFQAGKVGEALATQRQAVKLAPEDAELKQQLAMLEAAARRE